MLGIQYLVIEGLNQGLAGRISNVSDPAMGMTAFPGQVVAGACGAIGVEGHAFAGQPVYGAGRILHNQLHHLLVTQAGARCQGIVDVRSGAVVGVEHGSNATLSPGRRPGSQFCLGQQGTTDAGLCQP